MGLVEDLQIVEQFDRLLTAIEKTQEAINTTLDIVELLEKRVRSCESDIVALRSEGTGYVQEIERLERDLNNANETISELRAYL
jgi:chromosome segregation ATPase